jgi:hypothetical protein
LAERTSLSQVNAACCTQEGVDVCSAGPPKSCNAECGLVRATPLPYSTILMPRLARFPAELPTAAKAKARTRIPAMRTVARSFLGVSDRRVLPQAFVPFWETCIVTKDMANAEDTIAQVRQAAPRCL